MDVLCVGMYRSCSTWQYEVVAQLVERHRDGRRLGYLTGDEYADLLRREGHHDGWRVLKSHEEHPSFARAVAEGKAVVVYAFRDLRDVVFSMLHKRGVDFDTFLRQGMIHQILANDRFWSRQPAQITQRYEEIVARPEAAIEGLADHLGIKLEPGEAATLAAEYSLEANRRRTRAMAERLAAVGVDLSDPSNLQRWDERTLLHWNHVRDGRVGDWLERATPEQRVILARLGNRWLARHCYPIERPPVSLGLARRLDLARGRITCSLRCAALRHPTAGHALKRLLGLEPATVNRPPVRSPHFPKATQPAEK